MKVLLIAMAAATLTSVAYRQQFQDRTPAGSPVIVTAATQDDQGNCSATVTNTDVRQLAAVVAEVDGIRAEGSQSPAHFMMHDHFFKDNKHLAMMPKQLTLESACPDIVKPTGVSVKFIQFADGTVWNGNDPETTAEIKFQRNDAITYLKEMQGSSNLAAALATPPVVRDAVHNYSYREHEWEILRGAPDPVSIIADRLAQATSHADWLANLQ